MAIDFVEIISTGAIGNIKEADKALNKLLSTLNVTVQTANKLNIPVSGKTSPSASNANTTANNANIDRTARAIERQRLAEIRLQKAREQAFDKYEKALSREQAKLAAAQSLQAKTAAQIKALDLAYTELATKKARYNNLTDVEEKRLNTLTATLQKYRSIQDGVNVTVGKFQQRVGQYERGSSALSNSITQVSRELPALAVNTQTFFLAISNNLPAVFDAYTGIIKQNKELAAQGQPVKSFFKQLLGSLFSVQTALSVGITLLTLFGGEIVDAIFNTKEKAAADKAAKEAIEEKNKAEQQYNESINKYAGDEISRSKLLFENARNVNIQMSDRLDYISQLRERYPDYLSNLSNEQILAGNTAEAESKLNDALLKRGIAIALQEKLAKVYSKLSDELIKYQNLQNRGVTSSNTPAPTGDDQAMARLINRERKLGDERLKNSIERQKSIKDEIDQLLGLYNSYAPYLSAVNETNEALKKATDEIEKYAEANSKVAFERNISLLEERLSLMSQENAAYGILSGNLKILQGAYEALYGAQKDSNEEIKKTIKFGTEEYYTNRINKLKEEQSQLADTTEEYAVYNFMIQTVQDDLDRLTGKTPDVEKLNDAVKRYLETFTSGFFSDAGLPTLFKILNDEIPEFGENFATTFIALTEVAQEAYAFINQNSQAFFDAEYARLDKRKQLDLSYAGDSEKGKAEIERQYDEKRRQIRIREAKAQREAALFNIAINTAQGITAALATVPPNVPLSIVIGAIGVAQAAVVASKPIPAYKDGTDNHMGGLAIVGDGGKHELVHQPSKGWSITPDKSTVVDLEKGSKVFPDLANSGVFNSNLPDMIQLNSGGITKEEMERIMIKTMPKQNVNVEINKTGVKAFVREQASTTVLLNNSVSFKSTKV